MSQNRFWALGLAAKLLAVLLLLLLVVFPVVLRCLLLFGSYPTFLLPYLDQIQFSQSWAMKIVLLGFVFYFGSCFASFLNVVAWRIPRGRGVNGSSHCPHCNVKLNFWDNLPVIGWIRIGGQCRNCKAEVSSRYLIVEIILGLVFVLVFSAEMVSGGGNLPLRPVNTYTGFQGLVMQPKWDLIQLGAFQAILICYLFALAVIRTERLKIPQSIFWFTIGTGLICPMIWPSMLLVPWQIGAENNDGLVRFSTTYWMTLVVGAMVGLVCGGMVHWARAQRSDLNVMLETETRVLTMSEPIACLAVVGLYLGWQSTLVITILSLAFNYVLEAVGLEPKKVNSTSTESNSSAAADSDESVSTIEGGTSTESEMVSVDVTESHAVESFEFVPKTKDVEPQLEPMGLQEEDTVEPSDNWTVQPKTMSDSGENSKPLPGLVPGIYPGTNFAGMVLCGTVIHLVTWRWSNCLPGWPFGWQPTVAVCVSIVLLAGLAATLRIKTTPKLTS